MTSRPDLTGRVLQVGLWLSAAEGVVVSVAVLLSGPDWADALPRFARWPIIVATMALTVVLCWLAIRTQTDHRWRARMMNFVARLAANDRALWWGAALCCLLGLLSLVALLGVSLRMNPASGDLVETISRRGLLPLYWFALLVFQAYLVLILASPRPIAARLLPLAAGGLALGGLLVYWYGAEGQLLRFNLDMGLTDQSAYMEYARQLKDSGYTYPGDFNRMPVYPFLLSLVLRPGMTDPEFFLSAKYFNLLLSMVLLAALAVILFRRFEPLHALNLMLIVSFSVFIYKAGWVQAELLFYVLNTGLFLLLWRLVERPDVPTAIAAGIVAGLAHLTKASLWPGLFVFVVVAGVLGGLALARQKTREAADGATPRRASHWLAIVIASAVFLVVLAPYLRVSQRLTGRYFYNVNSTFYVWYDSWEEAEAGTKAYGDRLGWPVMPASEIPSLEKYLAEHTAAQMMRRLQDGAAKVMTRVLGSFGYVDYLLVYGGLLLAAAVVRWPRARRLIRENLPLLLFFFGYFSFYVLLYFWYAPIAAGDRLILALFIPLLLVLSSGLHAVLRGERFRLRGRSVSWLTLVNLGVLVMIVADAAWAVQRGVYILRGGG